MIFMTASKAKKEVNIMSESDSTRIRSLSGSFKGLSRANIILDTTIRNRINMSKDWLFVTKAI
jgi:hypothetical protein